MESSTIDFQNAKNRRRLINQNMKLWEQVSQIQAQVIAINEFINQQSQIQNSAYQPLLQQIGIQQRLIKQLRAKIQGFKLQRAKDNVQYIIHEEDDLKILKKLLQQLIDQKEVLTKKKEDKNCKLQNNLPYQDYEKKFLTNLMEVVHHNRQQGAQITEIQREIRKYHLLVKNGKFSTTENPQSHEDLHNIEIQINYKLEQKMQLEKQWKPHLEQLDEQYAKLLRQLSNKKQSTSELQRQYRNWDTRMLAVNDPEQIKVNKKRVNSVIVNPKLKQQLQDYMLYEEQRKKKKVNNQQLKYQFKSKAKEEEEAKQKQKKAQIPLPPAIANRKREDRIIQTLHDDKNISKKIEKGTNPPKKSTKVDQMHNTQISVPIISESPSSKDGNLSLISSSKLKSEDKGYRHWENAELPKKQNKTSSKTHDSKDQKNNFLQLKEVSIATDARLWKKIQQ